MELGTVVLRESVLVLAKVSFVLSPLFRPIYLGMSNCMISLPTIISNKLISRFIDRVIDRLIYQICIPIRGEESVNSIQ